MPLPAQIPDDVITNLPNTFGVYYFINAHKEIIYIGKSIDIKQRVKSHFYAASKNPKEKKLATQTHDIKYTTTAGELSALLLESYEIKQELPLYNRKLRKVSKQHAWRFDKTDAFYKPVLVDAVWPPIKGQAQFGAFKSLSHARKFLISLTKRHQLCAKVLGLESSGRSCFGYQLKQCQGACVGEESFESHNQRLLSSVNDIRLEQWPFRGFVGVVELASPNEVNVFDQWRFLGVFDRQSLNLASDNNELDVFLSSSSAYVLDRDSYKIVLSFLKHKESTVEVMDFSIGS